MSYSFTVAAADKAAAKQRISEEFDRVVHQQPSHAADRDAAVAVGQAFVDALRDPGAGEEIHVNMYGSVGWKHDEPGALTSAGVTANASIRAKAQG